MIGFKEGNGKSRKRARTEHLTDGCHAKQGKQEAKTHAEACFTLAECYEEGIGVDVADGVEAFKYYSKALKLGYRKAEVKVRELEKKLRAEAKGGSRERRIDAS